MKRNQRIFLSAAVLLFVFYYLLFGGAPIDGRAAAPTTFDLISLIGKLVTFTIAAAALRFIVALFTDYSVPCFGVVMIIMIIAGFGLKSNAPVPTPTQPAIIK